MSGGQRGAIADWAMGGEAHLDGLTSGKTKVRRQWLQREEACTGSRHPPPGPFPSVGCAFCFPALFDLVFQSLLLRRLFTHLGPWLGWSFLPSSHTQPHCVFQLYSHFCTKLKPPNIKCVQKGILSVNILCYKVSEKSALWEVAPFTGAQENTRLPTHYSFGQNRICLWRWLGCERGYTLFHKSAGHLHLLFLNVVCFLPIFLSGCLSSCLWIYSHSSR